MALEDPTLPELAKRWRRLVATLIDFALVPTLALGLMLVTGVLEHAEAWVWPQPLVRGIGLGLAAYLILNAWPLVRSGQTVGKWALRVRIVAAGSDDAPPAWRLVARAFALPALAFGLVVGVDVVLAFAAICLVFLVDAGFVAGRARRALHDHLIGTTVVAAQRRG